MLTKQYLDIWASASIFQNEKTIHWYSKTLQWDLKLAKALIQIKTNHAGGIIGGLTNGQELVFRIAVKPTSSTPQDQQTWNRETDQVETFAVRGRHDLCIALRVPVVLEAVTAMVLTDLLLLAQKIPPVLTNHNN